MTGCSTNKIASQPVVTLHENVEVILTGENYENVVKRYGNPGKYNQVGDTIFISYQGYGHQERGSFSNICFMEIQADSKSKKITSVKLGSNLGIDKIFKRLFNDFNVRDDCNRVFS